MDQQVSCQVVLYGTCKKWPAPLSFPLRGGFCQLSILTAPAPGEARLHFLGW